MTPTFVEAPPERQTHATFQFSLRWLLAATAVLAATFGVLTWRGITAAGFVLLAVLLLAAIRAVFRRRKFAAYAYAAAAIVPLVAIGLNSLGPKSQTVYVCPICGKERIQASVLGLVWLDLERDAVQSRWYEEVGLPSHEHEWRYLCSTERTWGGEDICADTFGFGTIYKLDRLREVWADAEPAERAMLSDLYKAVHLEGGDPALFFGECERLRRLHGLDAEGTATPDDP